MLSLTDAEYADLTDRVARVAAATLPADRFTGLDPAGHVGPRATTSSPTAGTAMRIWDAVRAVNRRPMTALAGRAR